MNMLRSLLSVVPLSTRHFSTSLSLAGEKLPVKKITPKKVDTPVVAAAAVLSPTVTALLSKGGKEKSPHNPRNLKKKHYHDSIQPKVDWVIDRTIPRDSVLSHFPHASHHWQDWKMLRDVKRRAYVERDGRVRKLLLSIYKTTVLPRELNEEAVKDILKLPRDSNWIRLINRCALTSRPRGVVQPWRLSRMVWRHYADYNRLSGVMRAKWANRNNPVYYHQVDPDLTGTLRALDPVYGDIHRQIHKREQKLSGLPRPPIQYNQNIYKKPFQYPLPTV